MKNDVNTSKSNKQKNFIKNFYFFVGLLKVNDKKAGSGSTSQRHGSADPDPHQNVMDPEHCCVVKDVNRVRPGSETGRLRIQIHIRQARKNSDPESQNSVPFYVLTYSF